MDIEELVDDDWFITNADIIKAEMMADSKYDEYLESLERN